jgi:septal ring factor EnvC (AmiA/AmiB activator)
MADLVRLPPDFDERCRRYRECLREAYSKGETAAASARRLDELRRRGDLQDTDARRIEADVVLSDGLIWLWAMEDRLAATARAVDGFLAAPLQPGQGDDLARSRMDLLDKRLKAAERRGEDLARDLAQTRQEAEQLRSRLADLESGLPGLSTRATALEQTVPQLRVQLDEIAQQIGQTLPLAARLDEIGKELTALRREADALRGQGERRKDGPPWFD